MDGDKKAPMPGDWAIMAGGLVALIGSFLDFSGDTNAWGSGALPIVTIIPLYCLAMGAQVALTKFGSVNLPERVAGFTWEQIHLVLGIFAAVMSLFWLVAADDVGAGLYLILLGSAACCVGAFLIQKERATGAIG